jgi:hypothetical protein
MPADRGETTCSPPSSEIIELIAASASLDDTLARIAIVVERSHRRCARSCARRGRRHVHGAAPSLPRLPYAPSTAWRSAP